MIEQLIVRCLLSGLYLRVNKVLFYFHQSCLCLTPHRCKVNPGCCCNSPQSPFLEKRLQFLLCFSFSFSFFFFFLVLIFLSMFFRVCKTLIKRALRWASVLCMDVQVWAVQLRTVKWAFFSMFLKIIFSSTKQLYKGLFFFFTEITWFDIFNKSKPTPVITDGWGPAEDHGLLKCINLLFVVRCWAWFDNSSSAFVFIFIHASVKDLELWTLEFCVFQFLSGLGVRLDPSLVFWAGFVMQRTHEESPDQSCPASYMETIEDGKSVWFCPVLSSCHVGVNNTS